MAVSAVGRWRLMGPCWRGVPDLPLGQMLGQMHETVAVYGSRGFTSLDDDRLVEQAQGFVEDTGTGLVKIKIGPRHPPRRGAAGPAAPCPAPPSQADGRRQRRLCPASPPSPWPSAAPTWAWCGSRNPVSSDDLAGLALLVGRAPDAGRDRRRGIRLGSGLFPPDAGRRRGGRAAGRRHPVRRGHGVPGRGGPGAGLRGSAVGALRPLASRPADGGQRQGPAHRMVPRPCRDRAPAVRRLPPVRSTVRSASTGADPDSALPSSGRTPPASPSRTGEPIQVTTTTERPTAPPARPVDSHSLERALAQAVDGEVRFDREARGLYSTDASHYRQVADRRRGAAIARGGHRHRAGSAATTAPRSPAAAAAPAWPASAATSPSSSTSPSTSTASWRSIPRRRRPGSSPAASSTTSGPPPPGTS